jgi:aspartate aminotransferase
LRTRAATSSISASASRTFPTPPHIAEAAIKAIKDGHHGYTPATGIKPLREAVAADLHKRFKAEVSPDLVFIAPGGKPTMFAMFARS